jgi:hypothetical protein
MPVVSSLIKTIVYGGLELFGRYYSCYRAYVADNEDPDGLQRLKLVIPQIGGNQEYNYWAYPKGVFFGPNYGSQVLPQKGDVVWVEFECGSPEVPIWSHGHPGKDEYPKDQDLRDVKCYWFRTPEGNLVKLYDTKNLIHIENTTGNYSEINEEGHSLVTDKQISLGSLNKAKEPAVLGDTAMDLLNELISDIGEIGVIQTSSGVTGKIKTSPQWGSLVEKWKEKFKNFKSTKVTLD